MNNLLRYEHHRQPVASRKAFLVRLGRNVLVAVAVLAVSLAVGMTGYMVFERMSLVEAYDNAAMILSGMGPYDEAASVAGKIFAGTYALYSGLLVLVLTGLVLGPVFHRVLHSFHVEDEDDEKRDEKKTAAPGRRGA